MGRSSSLLSVSEASVMVRWHTPNLCQPPDSCAKREPIEGHKKHVKMARTKGEAHGGAARGRGQPSGNK